MSRIKILNWLFEKRFRAFILAIIFMKINATLFRFYCLKIHNLMKKSHIKNGDCDEFYRNVKKRDQFCK